jgi:GNAT superfamily N-acetyltransferase
VGLTGIAPVGTCKATTMQQLRMLPMVFGLRPRRASRMSRWMSTWARHDPAESHSYLGPLAVDAHLQGQGIGTRILGEYTRRLDAAHEVGYLETDKPENVRLYERCGFVVTGEATVIGVQNWFMRREPLTATS